MDLPTIPEQLLEADRLCAESQRLLTELHRMAIEARRRCEKMKHYNERRWDVRFAEIADRPKRRTERRKSGTAGTRKRAG
jgi:hypothetical protein